jgi:hypothetical protein
MSAMNNASPEAKPVKQDFESPEMNDLEAAAPINMLVDPHDALIRQYRATMSNFNDPLGAVLASETAELMRFGNKYQKLLDAGIAQAATIADLEDLDDAIKTRMSMHRHVQAYAKLSMQLEQADQRAAGRMPDRH